MVIKGIPATTRDQFNEIVEALEQRHTGLANAYRTEHMTAYSRLQEAEFASEERGYTATKHQREVGTGYFDEVAQAISGGLASTLALVGSTESEQFH